MTTTIEEARHVASCGLLVLAASCAPAAGDSTSGGGPAAGGSAPGASGHGGSGQGGSEPPNSGGTGGWILTGGSAGAGGAAGTSAAPVTIDECPGPLDAAVAQALAAGGASDANMRWLYPYDRTVFPRGLQAPILQWAPAGNVPAQAVYLRLASSGFTYRGCFGPTSPARLPVPQHVWDIASSLASGPSDPITIELTTVANGKISGPLGQMWAIAPATLKGALYYNTYGSPQVQNNGAVMRLIPGQPQPQAFLSVPGVAPLGPCMSCHSVSANGQSMIAARHFYPIGPYQSFSYDIQANPNPNPPQISPGALDGAAFSAIFPDGSKFMTNGSPGTTSVFPLNGPGNVVGVEGPRESRLFAINGTPLQASGWSAKYAKMPMFSPDGRHIVFNDHQDSSGHSLAVMDFDTSSNTFSNYRRIFGDPALYPGWPFFTPDSKGVVFVLADVSDYVSSYGERPVVAHSDLYYVHLATLAAVRLARAGGFDGGASFLPYPGRDEHYDFFPTVSPVAAGGQFWLFFTSRRNYGNTIVGGVDVVASKKIWVSAIDIDPVPGTDPSHPAFYLPGQEQGAGNIRAFAALEPCRADGDSCSSGIQCCCGACDITCSCPQGCSKVDDRCTISTDCCDPEAECINGFCAEIIH
ncbi:MAG: hypothetical protein IT371_31915 [Deltaproteobacteria bacterium]|nr:hypothetical protein [Deltaproteobacteria bacterium]